jgi:transposase-like protein
MNRKISSARPDYWRKLIGEQSGSGQSVSAFCRGRGVSDASFYTWRKRLSEETPLKFALVEAEANRSVASCLELSLTSGERLHIVAGVDVTTLRMVLSVLRERR